MLNALLVIVRGKFRHSNFKMTTLFDYLTMQDKNVSTLRVGAPSIELRIKCGELIQKATQELHIKENYANILQYGPHNGTLEVRSELANFLSDQYGSMVDSNDVWINAGATQGFQYIGNLLFQPGDIAFVEEPTYFIGLTALRDDFGMNVIGVPTDQDGMIVDEFEKLLSQYCHQMRPPTERKPFSGMLYCIPTFNNPTGSVLPEERCKKLIKLLRRYNMLAFCDDVYNLLSFIGDKPPFSTPPRLYSFDDKSDLDYKGHVISNGSFSKILAPGLRLGWMEVPEHVRKILHLSGHVRSGGCFNHYTSCIVAMALKMGLIKEHLTFVQKVYRNQLNTLCSALENHMPCPFTYRKPEGGYFVWVVLPLEVDCDKLYDICFEKYNVDFNKGSGFSSSGQFKNCMRLSFAFHDGPVIEHCVKHIALAIKEILDCN